MTLVLIKGTPDLAGIKNLRLLNLILVILDGFVEFRGVNLVRIVIFP